MTSAETAFLNDLDKKLWNAADRLRSSLDAAVYKHVILGLIFLKYASDAFESRKEELERRFRDPEDDYHMDPQTFGLTYDDDVEKELEVRDYYTEANVFWVPRAARWNELRDAAKLPVGAKLAWDKTMRGVGFLLDDALTALSEENERLRGILARDTFTRHEVRSDTLAGLIDRFSDRSFSAPEWNGRPLDLKSRDILGHVYEYFLGEFALQEGKKGGQYYTPKSIVTLIVEMLRPYRGRVYDPAMGSGGFFVQSETFIEEHSGNVPYNAEARKKAISLYGQESNPTTWRLAAMNMAIRGLDFDFGKGPADSFAADQHPDLRADFVMANPPFNMREWGLDRVGADDPRWVYGVPPANNANFAWLQHMLYHLAPAGSLALLLSNGSMSSGTGGEGEIRKRLVEADLVECMVALPGQLFTNTQIPACIWLLARSKGEREVDGERRRDRRGEILFLDARSVGYMKDRVLRDFAPGDLERIAGTFHAWRSGEGYADMPGFCRSADLAEVRGHEWVLTPGRYVGAAEGEAEGEAFAEKMARLTGELGAQFAESDRLEEDIKANLAGLGLTL